MSTFKDPNSSFTEDSQRNIKGPQSMQFPQFPPNFPLSADAFSGLSMPMIPPNLLLAMQSNLPPEKVREMLTEQADMLEQMVAKMKNSQEDDEKKPAVKLKQEENDSFRVSNQRKVPDFERESRRFPDSEREIRDSLQEKRNFDRKDDFCAQRDVEMLKQELSTIKMREESTYLELQKAHHQIHMLESQLLELQRKHFTELEHLNFDNSEIRRKLEAAEFRNSSLLKDNDYLKSQISALKRQQETYERTPEVNESLYTDEGIKGEFAPHEANYRREAGIEPSYRRDYDSSYRRDGQYEGNYKREGQYEGNYKREGPYEGNYKREGQYEGNYKRENVQDGNYRRESAKRFDNRYEKSPEENIVNRKKTVVKVEPVEYESRKKEYLPVRTIVNSSNSVTEALNWNTHKRNDTGGNVTSNLQQKLGELVNEQNRLKSEIERLSEIRGSNASKRKADLEVELSICDSNVNSLTAKLRKMNWLSNS